MSTTVAFRSRRVLATAAILAMAFGPWVASRDVARADETPPLFDEQPEREDVSSDPVSTEGSSPPGTDETPPREDGPSEGDASRAEEPREDEPSEGDGSGVEEPRGNESAPPGDPARESEPQPAPEPTGPAEEPSGEQPPADEPSRHEAPQGEAPDDPASPPSSPPVDREVSLVREGDLVVEKLVDADGDGVFADEEDAQSATSDVTFRVTLANVGEATLEVVSVVDQVGAETLDLLAEPACATLEGALAAGSSVSCDLTIERYLRTHASQPRSELTNVVEAVATDGETSIGASDHATVYNPNALVVSAAVDLTNDADGDGVFTDDEEAPTPLGDVPVRIEVTNTSPGAVVITELVGVWDGGVDLLATACPELDGMKLWGVGGGHDDGGEHDDGTHDDGGHDGGADDGGADHPGSVVCLTTLADHAPAAGASRTDTVTVTLGKKHSPDRTASATDSTTVWLPVVHGVPDLQVSLGIAELGRDLQFDEWVAIRLQHDVVTWVQLQAVVTNTGATPLVEPTLDAPGLSMADCSLPDVLAEGEDVLCDFDLVPAEYGDHEFEVMATAMGAGELVEATSSIGYSGFVQNGWPDERTPDDGTPAPVPTPAPLTPTWPADAGGASPDALAFTGFAIGPWAGTGLASLLLGLALLLATGGIGARAPTRVTRRPVGEDR